VYKKKRRPSSARAPIIVIVLILAVSAASYHWIPRLIEIVQPREDLLIGP
jgi:hypothetical protein